ncbi:hypothetical protein [Streptomyces sp. NPDC004783]|uniref:hypothetical protein n=1 Tax=Streptomyces sp. NPDC004783 TaxID=3154459 RepID=UPI0033B98EBF
MRARTGAEAIVASVTGPVAAPSTLLLGRYDKAGRLRFIARTAPLAAPARREVGCLLQPGGAQHPWQHRRFSEGWGTRETLATGPVVSDIVIEFAADTAVDEGRYRHPVCYLRVRDDITSEQLPPPQP